MKNTMAEMVAAVKAHAEAHYEEGGWDNIVDEIQKDHEAEARACRGEW